MENPDIERSRIRKIFQYLEALNQLRNAPKRQIQEQPWFLWFKDIPQHESIQKGVIGDVQQLDPGQGGELPPVKEDIVLKVKRPQITHSPAPPETIRAWLMDGWEQVDGSVETIKSKNDISPKGETILVLFEDDPERPRTLEQWARLRNEWVLNEKPAREALKLFERLYELHGQIEREAERVELVLGDGVLNWRVPQGGVHHPILFIRLQLEFDPEIPEFTLSETGQPTELYSALFRTIAEDFGRALGNCRDELEKGGYHPLGGDDTSGFLRRIVAQLHARGQFVGFNQIQGEQDFPRLGRSPVIFMRARTLGFANALEAVLEDIKKRAKFPHSLVNIVGIDKAPAEQDQTPAAPWVGSGNENADILLSKPANIEQLHIAERLNKYGCVVVQGPPGTGKTHTIGNLLGHLLAEGKSVLVTSHTTKALRVLRDKVADPLQPLCVSVLESDLESRKQLESSVSRIVERLGSASVERLEEDARAFRSQRAKILEQLDRARRELLTARASEYDEIVVAGKAFPPSEAARYVAKEAGQHNWIPSPVVLGQPLPLSSEEVVELYKTNISVPSTDQSELEGHLPELDSLMRPEEFRARLEEQAKLEQQERQLFKRFWKALPPERNVILCPACSTKNRPEGASKKKATCRKCGAALPEQIPNGESAFGIAGITRLLEELRRVTEVFSRGEPWRLAAIGAGHAGGAHRLPWDSLLKEIAAVCEKATNAQEILFRIGPVVPEGMLSEDTLFTVEGILAHLSMGGSLSWWTNIVKPKWKAIISMVTVSGKSPHKKEHFEAIKVHLEISLARMAFSARWDRQMVPLGAPKAKDLGDTPESSCKTYAVIMGNCLEWHATHLDPFLKELEKIGLVWEKVLECMPPKGGSFAELERVREAARTKLPEILASKLAALQWEANETAISELQGRIGENLRNGSEVLDFLAKAISQRDGDKYEAGYGRLAEVLGRQTALDRRRSLLKKLSAVAPAWAAGIEHRQPPHATGNLPGDFESAWLWRQLNDTLDFRGRLSPEELQQRIESLNESLQRITVELIDRLAWAAQARRTTLPQRMALMGWEQVIRRIGKGTGKRVVRLEAEARCLMDKCRSAVPVWVMPLSRVVDNFNPALSCFDVVIIDEASQCDIMALIALYMAKQVVIVGDHEQVSPDAVGQDITQVQHLIDEHLSGIPNAVLYTGQLSIYDLARQSFAGLISLKEHFRCVNDVIQFSNHLSYNGTIRPLRDSTSTDLRPFVIEHRVNGACSEWKVNSAEALEVASLVVAAIEHPHYEGMTFGVISLVGEEQAWEIERLIRNHISPADYEERRIVCGNAAHFQGDERNVMFLSVVDSPGEGPLSLRETPMFKKRFNVAASRAKDQMWVVHSLRSDVDLKPSDLRRRLIEYARDPKAIIRLLEQHDQRAESPFERLVIRHLVAAGFKVDPQWKVGHYRIDLVVTGQNGSRLAIECDGDRYHPREKLAEDMQRQAVLERLGWRFIRIRGSQFYRDQEHTMRPVFERLKTLGLEPCGHGDSAVSDADENSLRSALIRRAAELRQQWATEPESETESSSRRTAGRRWGHPQDRKDQEAPKASVKPAAMQIAKPVISAQLNTAAPVAQPKRVDLPVEMLKIADVLLAILPDSAKMKQGQLIPLAVAELRKLGLINYPGPTEMGRACAKVKLTLEAIKRQGLITGDGNYVWKVRAP